MAEIYLSLVFHNHQPVGNFDFVFQEAYEKAYKPLTDCLDRHPSIQVAMHFTGPLLDWLKKTQPEYLQQVAAQVKRGQLEILSGAYYEPILMMLHDEDKIGQTRKLTTTVEELFGTTPTGMWLAERIWEPHLPKPIYEADINYTIIDDKHFVSAGFHDEQLFGYFVSEEQGYTVNLVPTQTALRYLIPWRPVSEVIHWLGEQAEHRQVPGKPPVWAVMADDGEKFGHWPMTFDSIWGEGWMDEFFQQLEANADWIKTIHPGEYVQRFRARGIAYLPTASYLEMSEWALPSPASYLLRDLRESYELQLQHIPEWDRNKREEIEQVLRFLQGSFWRNFLVKYPEINHMQKRGLALSKQIHALPDGEQKTEALDALWASQCNCGYWHGVFGGVYLFHIRSANYRNIIKAETLLQDGEDNLWHKTIDFNADSYEEIMAGNGPLAMVIQPDHGGMLTELDYRPALYNLLNIMTRHPEGYHIQIREAAATNMLMVPGDNPNQFEGEPVRAKEHGLEHHIYEDWHQRGMLIDHFLGDHASLHGFESAQYPEQGDFVNQAYETSLDQQGDTLHITLSRDGNVWIGDLQVPVRVEKRLSLVKGQPTIDVNYQITNLGDVFLSCRFGIEMAFGFDGGDNDKYCYIAIDGGRYSMGVSGEIPNMSKYYAVSQIHEFGIRFELDQSATLWRFPLAPITLSEGGFERVHQGLVTMPWWRIELVAGDTWEIDMKVSIESIN